MNANKGTDIEGIAFYSDDANPHKKTHVAVEIIFKTVIVWRIDNWGAEAELYLIDCHKECLKIHAAAYGM